LTLQTDNIPEELRALPQWVGRRGKIPLNPATGEGAKAGVPSTWGTLEQAVTGVNAGRFEGIGFEFATGDGLVGIDLDHVVDPHTGEVQPWALEIVQRLDSYTEYSPSGTGLHIFVHGDIPDAGRKKTFNKDTGEAVELYKEKRYFTVTAKPFHPAPIADRSAELTALYAELFPHQQNHTALSPAIDAPEYLRIGLDKDRTFRALWDGYRNTGDESSNDLALMNKLAYWCNRDEGRMIEAFLASPYAAGKDDAHRAKLEREDYLHRTAQKAIADCRETAADRDAAFKLERARRDFAPLSANGDKPEVEPADYSDAGNAAVFSRLYAGKLLYADSLGWLWWNGQKWDRSDHHATRCALEMSGAMYQDALTRYSEAKHAAAQAEIDFAGEAISKSDRDKAREAETAAKAYFKHAATTRNATRINSFISLSIPSFLIKADKLDANPFDLNTPAGIVDLRSGGVRPHDPEAYCTQITACSPGTAGEAMWSQFMDWVTGGDQGVREYLQMVAGMAAVGEVYQEGVVMAYGPGGNGKSTCVNAIGNVFGEYAGSIAIKVLTTERQNSGPALATMRGKRLVVAGELEENQRLSVSTLKQLASTDKLVIEEKYHSPEVVKQTHTLVLFTNHLPRVGSTDGGTWRRLTVVPFLSKVSPDKSVLNYTETLTREAGEAIMSWVVHGAVKFCANHFKIPLPDVVAKATEEYQARENWLSNFISERCTKDPNGRVQSSELYAAYKEWSQSTGDYTRRLNDFSTAMEAAGFLKIAPRNIKHWQGLILNPIPLPDYGYSNSRYSQ
jgi:putative DNA primase/helicase